MVEAVAYQPEIIDKHREYEAQIDAITQFSELLDGSMLTSFELDFDGQTIYGPDGRALREVTEKAEADAERIVRENPELHFEPRRRKLESEEIELAHAMAREEIPNVMIITSDFPTELKNAKEDVGGYNVTRQQTMLRVLARLPNGKIQMYSKTLDGSNREALEAIYAEFGEQPKPGELLGQRIHRDMSVDEQQVLIDRLTGIYDRSMTAQFGGKWYAGRRPADVRNTYDFVCTQHDLVNESVRLTLNNQLTDDLMYDLAATMQKRFANAKQGVISIMPRQTAPDLALLHHEIQLAGAAARQQGVTFSACGGTLRGNGYDTTTENLMSEAGYGNKAEDEDEFGPLTFECTNGHSNRRPRGKLIDQCRVRSCKNSVSC